MLLVFAAGYVMGARAGDETLDEVIDAVHALRESDEFHDLVQAVRAHAAQSLHGLATMIEHGMTPQARTPTDHTGESADLVDQVRSIFQRR